MQTRNYETQNGEKRTAYNIVAESVDFFCGEKKENNTPNSNFEQTMKQNGVDFTTSDDDLPF